MKLLIDEALSRRAVTWLQVTDEAVRAEAPSMPPPVWDEITYLRDVAPGATDDEILAWARAHDHVIVTLDKADFGERLAQQGARSPSVIVLRDMPLPPDQAMALFRWLRMVEEDLRTGAIVVLTPERPPRVRKLPIESRP
jgi:predicted nuclease of predicted toxin-antitoxin system